MFRFKIFNLNTENGQSLGSKRSSTALAAPAEKQKYDGSWLQAQSFSIRKSKFSYFSVFLHLVLFFDQ